jgi:ADP-heptose:LPS heptosyltransferase
MVMISGVGKDPAVRVFELDPLFGRLHRLAYGGNHRDVYRAFRQLTAEQRERLVEDSCVAASVVIGAAQQLDPARGSALERLETRPAGCAPTDGAEAVDAHLDLCLRRHSARLPRPLFSAVEAWAGYLAATGRHMQRVELLKDALLRRVDRYPSVRHTLTVLLAHSHLELGEPERALELLQPYLEGPYRLTERSGLESTLHAAAVAYLGLADVRSFRWAAWSLLRSFATATELKRETVRRLAAFYRGTVNLALARHPDASAFAKLIALLVALEGALRSRWTRPLARPLRLGITGLLYVHNYSKPNRIASLQAGLPALRRAGKAPGDAVLVTRAMGGIGDLLMMTPGFSALKARNPEQKIDLAVPRAFFPLFEGNADVTLRDIEEGEIAPFDYSEWYNLSDCPASRVESRTAPRVVKNRIEIFAEALGISEAQLDRCGRAPRYFVSEQERRYAKDFVVRNGLTGRKLIALQPYAADTYRDYPRFESLAARLAQHNPVLVFHNIAIEGYELANVTKVDRYPLRQSVALLSQCSFVVAADSSFVHFAAALGLPGLALFGPTDGRIRTRDYGCVEALDLRSTMKCIPCWRHEYSPCLLTGGRTSVCMHALPVDDVYRKVKELMARHDV